MWMCKHETLIQTFSMAGQLLQSLIILGVLPTVSMETIPLPLFSKLKTHYPGYYHHGGQFRNHHLIRRIGCEKDQLLHDTSALRLSYALNKIGGKHSLGKQLIRLSKYGRDSVTGRHGLQYMYHPIAYGPYLADKYGYPSVSKLHQQDPKDTKKRFWGKQGILRVITYTKHSNLPIGHVALWDCNHFHQSKDWIAGHSLITVEFWESPDSNCTSQDEVINDISQQRNNRPDIHFNKWTLAQIKLLSKKYMLEKARKNGHVHHVKTKTIP